MTDVVVRPYRDEDYERVVELTVGPLRQSRKDAEEVISGVPTVEPAEIFVAEKEGNVVGHIMMEYPGSERWAKIAYISWIAVDTERQRKGYGSKLIRAGEESARKRGMRRLYIEPTIKDDYTICFYIMNGLMPEGRRIGYYPDGLDSVVLGKDLLERWSNVSALEDMPKLSFRRFEERDTEGIGRIYRQFFEDCPELKNEEGLIVAELAGEIVGFVAVMSHSTYPWWDRDISSWCEIEELHVHHKLWGRGIGTQLVQKALEYAKSKGAEAIYVGTEEDNYRTRGLYEKSGFTEHRRLIRYKQRIS